MSPSHISVCSLLLQLINGHYPRAGLLFYLYTKSYLSYLLWGMSPVGPSSFHHYCSPSSPLDYYYYHYLKNVLYCDSSKKAKIKYTIFLTSPTPTSFHGISLFPFIAKHFKQLFIFYLCFLLTRSFLRSLPPCFVPTALLKLLLWCHRCQI